MRRIALATALGCALFGAGALAQRALTLPKATDITKIELSRDDDGAISLTVYAQTAEDADGGVTVSRPHTCAVSSLTTAQKSCLTTLRNASLSCWNSAEGL